jgi:hypothetical protein
MASTTETVFIEIYLFFLFVGTHANSSWGRPFREIAQLCPPQSFRVRCRPPLSFARKRRAGTRATPHLSEPRLRGISAANGALPMTLNKNEVPLLKAEQANSWRIVAATAPVKRPRVFIIRYPSVRPQGGTLVE